MSRVRRRAGRVVRALHWEMLGPSRRCRVPVTLCWSAEQPFEVVLWFPQVVGEPGGVYWRVARDLLADGLSGPTGLGDVAVLPDPGRRRGREVILSSPEGIVGLRVPARVLRSFLRATWRRVPRGAEVLPEPSMSAFTGWS